jgi:flavin reductase (DIM6/NTAB) family NADH-FMN oxidoreductase RutF
MACIVLGRRPRRTGFCTGLATYDGRSAGGPLAFHGRLAAAGKQATVIIRAQDLDAEETYKLLTGVVVPRPIAWVTTRSAGGVVNLAPFSAFTFVSNKPPMLGINIGHKGSVRKDTANHISASGEFVVHIAHSGLTPQVHASAVEHPPEVSEVELLGLHTVPSTHLAVPRLADAPIAMECRLHSVTPFGDAGAEFFVGEVLCWHLREGLMVNGKIDSFVLDPVCRLAGPNYATLGRHLRMAPIAQSDKKVLSGG